jgi:hypothetical protein
MEVFTKWLHFSVDKNTFLEDFGVTIFWTPPYDKMLGKRVFQGQKHGIFGTFLNNNRPLRLGKVGAAKRSF